MQTWSWFLPSTQLEFAGFSHGPVGVNTPSASASTSTSNISQHQHERCHPLIFIPRLKWEVLPFDTICFGRFRIYFEGLGGGGARGRGSSVPSAACGPHLSTRLSSSFERFSRRRSTCTRCHLRRVFTLVTRYNNYVPLSFDRESQSGQVIGASALIHLTSPIRFFMRSVPLLRRTRKIQKRIYLDMAYVVKSFFFWT